MNFKDNTHTVLIVEDEPTLGQILSEYLQQSGFNTHIIAEGLTVIDWIKAHKPNLVILDLMLPHRDGLDIYRELRTFSDVPVIMATAKVEEIDRLLGLELGADDYICKPYSSREVVARVKNIVRRNTPKSQTQNLIVNEDTMTAHYYQKALQLTPAEFKLLHFLFNHQDKIYSRNQLMDKIYQDSRIVTDRTIDSHIKNLRRKLH
ncbi:response regulator [Pseudoalteromonas sp. TB64]|uniref:response regulator n=1 Tax=Pseudoalteromonas sp. TB64 TaxID=1938600 RepID=UPI00040FC394|nr:response regulator [Pseudoalteromonas sp. TB64]